MEHRTYELQQKLTNGSSPNSCLGFGFDNKCIVVRKRKKILFSVQCCNRIMKLWSMNLFSSAFQRLLPCFASTFLELATIRQNQLRHLFFFFFLLLLVLSLKNEVVNTCKLFINSVHMKLTLFVLWARNPICGNEMKKALTNQGMETEQWAESKFTVGLHFGHGILALANCAN